MRYAVNFLVNASTSLNLIRERTELLKKIHKYFLDFFDFLNY